MNKENNKTQIILTFQALKYDSILSLKKIVSTYSIPLNIFFYKKQNYISKHNYTSKSQKLINIKEKAII